MQGRSTGSIIIGAAIFILLEIAALAMLRRSSTLQNIWINRASHHVMATLWSGGEVVRNHFALREVNAELAEENARLSALLRKYQSRERGENETAAAAEALDNHFRYIPATIVKMSRNTAHNYIILNKGSEDGIKPQSGIITEKGVVGVINAVDKHYSYGLTLMNTGVSIGTRVGHSGVVAPVVWNGKSTDGAYAKDIAPHYEIHPGDTVWTSGFSSIFPAGIPVGVTGNTKLIDGSTQQIDVTLFQDFSNVHYVTIVENLERNQIISLETDGGDVR